jgi:hypothetical protein
MFVFYLQVSILSKSVAFLLTLYLLLVWIKNNFKHNGGAASLFQIYSAQFSPSSLHAILISFCGIIFQFSKLTEHISKGLSYKKRNKFRFNYRNFGSGGMKEVGQWVSPWKEMMQSGLSAQEKSLLCSVINTVPPANPNSQSYCAIGADLLWSSAVTTQ